MTKALKNQVRRMDFGVFGSKRVNSINRDTALRSREPFRYLHSSLWREQAEQDLANAFLIRPEVNKFLQVSGRKKSRNYGAVNDDPVTRHMPEDALVGCRRTSGIMVIFKAVHRNSQVQIGEFSPLRRYLADSARNDLHFYSQIVQFRD